MVNYASQNWDNCKPEPCHTNYHFDDVAIQRDKFDRSYQGTNSHDLVAAIGAAIAVLKEQPPPAPFRINSKREALLLLTHFVGDLHQPLHVGAIYLGADGKPIDPDVAHAVDQATSTAGGNAIQDQNLNLHFQWDEISIDIGDAFTRELLAEARAMPPKPGPN